MFRVVYNLFCGPLSSMWSFIFCVVNLCSEWSIIFRGVIIFRGTHYLLNSLLSSLWSTIFRNCTVHYLPFDQLLCFVWSNIFCVVHYVSYGPSSYSRSIIFFGVPITFWIIYYLSCCPLLYLSCGLLSSVTVWSIIFRMVNYFVLCGLTSSVWSIIFYVVYYLLSGLLCSMVPIIFWII